MKSPNLLAMISIVPQNILGILPDYMKISTRHQRHFPCLAPCWPLDGRNAGKETRNDSCDTIFKIGYLR